MQKFRADKSEVQADGAIVWRSDWMGGPSLARINNCRLQNLAGNMRATVYVTGEADTWFSVPAVCKIKGCRVRGYVTGESDTGDIVALSDARCNLVFRHCYY